MKIRCEKTNREAECKYCNKMIEKGEPRITAYTMQGEWHIQRKYHVECFKKYILEWAEIAYKYEA